MLKKMHSIKVKLYGSTFLSIFLLLMISLSGIFNINSVNNSIKSIKNHQELSSLYNDMAFHMVRSNSAIRGYMIYNKDIMRKNHFSIRKQDSSVYGACQKIGRRNRGFRKFEKDFGAWESSIDQKVFH